MSGVETNMWWGGLDIDESQEPIHAKCIKHIKTVLDKYKKLKTSVDEQIDHLHKLKYSLEKDQICLGNLEKRAWKL